MLLVLCSVVTPACALPVAWLKNVRPTVEVRDGESASWKPARERRRLHFGSYVRTGKSGKTLVLFSNGTELVLGNGTHIQLLSPATSRAPLVVRVFGTLSEVFVKAKGNTQIRTAAGIAAVRGTQYLVRVVDETSTEVTVTEGAVAFYNERGEVLLKSGNQSRATVGTAPTQPVIVDVSGLLEWTADITGLPVEFETPYSFVAARTLQQREQARSAAVASDPNDAAARARLAEVLYDSGRYSEAIGHWSEAARSSPDNATLRVGLGRAMLAAGDAPGAQAEFERALQIAPDDVTARVGIALAQLGRQNDDAARAALNGVDDPSAETVRGLISLRQGQNKAAITQFEAVLKKSPQSYQAHSLLALALLSQGETSRAQDAARKAVALQPASAQAQGALAMTLFFAGKTSEATRAATRAVELNPLSPFALMTQGRALLSQQKTDEARDAFQMAQSLAPHLPLLNLELGSVYLRLDMPQKAEASYRRALQLDPVSTYARSALGVALQKQGRTAEALAEQQRAIEIDPQNSMARSNLAAFYIEQGDFKAAQEQLVKGVLNAPERGVLYVRLSELSLYRQDLGNAEQYARRAVGLLPASNLAHYQLGRVYLEQDRVFQAEQQFRQAVTLDPHFAPARYAFGLVRERSQSGLFGRSSLGANTLGSAASSLSLQNLQSPGAADRIQGLSQDPTVARIATRSFGDTQLGAIVGAQSTYNLDASHIESINNNRGVVALSAERRETDGVRANADEAFDRIGIVIGQKQQDNPSGFFIIGQIERRNEGQNDAFRSDPIPFNATARVRSTIPRALVGYKFKKSENHQTRVLMQYSAPRTHQTTSASPAYDGNFNFDSINVEARHDWRLSTNHRLVAGLFAGDRKRDVSSQNLPPFGISLSSQGRLRASGAYIRDELALGKKLSLTSELQLQRMLVSNRLVLTFPPLPTISTLFEGSSTDILPKLILAYQPSPQAGLRLRLRRLAGSVDDFQLLRPTDAFAELENLPDPDLLSGIRRNGTGRSVELEYDHTFKDASFARVTLFHQDLRLASNFDTDSATYGRVRQYGGRLSYEAALGRNTTCFLRADLTQARDVNDNEDVVQVPHYAVGAGLQYLNRKGFFIQPLLLLQDDRLEKRFSSTTLSDFSFFNLRAGKRWGLRTTVFAELGNAFDTDYSVLQDRQPGRNLRLGLIQRF